MEIRHNEWGDSVVLSLEDGKRFEAALIHLPGGGDPLLILALFATMDLDPDIAPIAKIPVPLSALPAICDLLTSPEVQKYVPASS